MLPQKIYVCLYLFAAAARNILITIVTRSLSLHIDMSQDARKVLFQFLSHCLSAAVDRREQILMEVHPPLCSAPVGTTTTC